ncbi:MAG: hypothetical protein LAT67_05055 [Balneolales bacterium]|nr:hypothetical protein [Balneolales bacterium]
MANSGFLSDTIMVDTYHCEAIQNRRCYGVGSVLTSCRRKRERDYEACRNDAIQAGFDEYRAAVQKNLPGLDEKITGLAGMNLSFNNPAVIVGGVIMVTALMAFTLKRTKKQS